MTATYHSVMVTGHRPQHLTAEQQSFARAELDRLAVKVRDEHGAVEAISGMALGADTWWAQAALAAGLTLAAYIPSEGQPSKWRPADRERWRELRAAARREVVVGGAQYDVRMLHARNDAMLRDADLVIAVWSPSKTTGGTASAVRKARALGLDVVVVDLDQLSTRIERRV